MARKPKPETKPEDDKPIEKPKPAKQVGPTPEEYRSIRPREWDFE